MNIYTSNDKLNKLRHVSRIEFHWNKLPRRKEGMELPGIFMHVTWHEIILQQNFVDISGEFRFYYLFYFFIDHTMKYYYEELRGEHG